ncbi:MAG: ATP-binding protein [Hungatella sp.]|nr:ATP-binding protein [Hungatella sp.]
MTVVAKEQYMEAVRHLAAQKMKLAFLRTADSAQETGEAAVQRLSDELKKEEDRFWKMSERELEKGEFLPLEYLCGIRNCGPFERHLLLLALGYEVNPHMAGDCAYLHNDGSRDYLTPWLAEITWHEKTGLTELCETFSEESAFMQMFFQTSEELVPFMEHKFQLKKRIRSFLLWELEEDKRLSRILSRWEPDQLQPSLGRQQPDIAALLEDGIRIVELYGEAGTGRRFCAKTACGKLGRTAYLINLEEMCGHRESFERLADSVLLECVLFQALPVLCFPEDLSKTETDSPIKELIHSLLGVSEVVFVISRRPFLRALDGGALKRLVLEISDLSLLEKRDVWRQEAMRYSFAGDIHVEEMANLFHFTHGKIKEALRHADENAKSRGKKVIDKESLRRGCYSFFERSMVKRAVRIPVVYGLNDLVLPVLQKESILAACNQVKYKHKIYEEWGFGKKMPYGRGISMIFAGAPGTGKTMAAQAVAAELGIDLYKVELSAVVSKYVGETEKNLDEIFEQAKQSQIILFFDEADVLFSKRTEVKDANDKYNNMEAAFLLQKMEAYDGVTILATNLLQNFDEAFKRRVKFVIDFPFPDCARRKELWERAIPAQMPAEELDLDYLASNFELSGSNIRNIVLHAAFLAASKERKIGMQEILMAVKNEFAKSGKTLTKEDTGEYHILLPDIH